MPDGLAMYAHGLAPSLQAQTCKIEGEMSYPKKSRDLALALRLAYPGPGKAERIAQDLGVSLSTAKNLLSGLVPSVWERIIDLIEKRPAFLAHALKTTWAEELSIRAEINETRGRILEWEKRLAKTKTLAGANPQPDR